MNRLVISHLKPQTVWCVGRNFRDHIKELPSMLGISNEVPSEPMIFMKSASSILMEGGPIRLPSWTADVHHEVELAVQLNEALQPQFAAVAIDLTARDVQAMAKKKGYPWTMSKSFKTACPLGSVFSLDGVDVQEISLELTVNGATKQKGSTADMIFPVSQIIQYLIKKDFPVAAGDWILTGTPAGVARIVDKDQVIVKASNQKGVLSQGSWEVAQNKETS
jgi:2-keto-4-pentenoate hydratase/2-oxohepta-3-ene-1,7-dioic acid hydratase in catechol pathway